LLSQYYGCGQTIGGSKYYYSKDHLGSIREMTDGSGTIVAEYAYSPWGQVTVLQTSVSADFQYAGLYKHAPSGLSLAVHRSYSSSLGSWLNRDPRESFGISPYNYAANNPISLTDPLGLTSSQVPPGFVDDPGNEAGFAVGLGMGAINNWAGISSGYAYADSSGTGVGIGIGIGIGGTIGGVVGGALGGVLGAGTGVVLGPGGVVVGAGIGAAEGSSLGTGAGILIGGIAGGAIGATGIFKSDSSGASAETGWDKADTECRAQALKQSDGKRSKCSQGNPYWKYYNQCMEDRGYGTYGKSGAGE
jgi:RHS repeat-associated protein